MCDEKYFIPIMSKLQEKKIRLFEFCKENKKFLFISLIFIKNQQIHFIYFVDICILIHKYL